MPKMLHVSGYGVKLGVDNGSLSITSGDKKTIIPLSDVDVVVVASSGVSITSRALRVMLRSGIELVVLDHRGDPIGIMYSSHYTRTPETRRMQYLAYNNGQGVTIAVEIASSKMHNQACHLKRYHYKNRGMVKDAIAHIQELVSRLRDGVEISNIDEARRVILKYEAEAARVYWSTLGRILPENLEFEGRSWDSGDPVNSSLNYGYAILYSLAWRALVLAGLDPYAGFLHVDRSGKPVLAFDYVEMFRVKVVDSPLIDLFMRGWKPKVEDGRLDYKSREKIVEAISRALKGRIQGEDMSVEEAIRRYAWRLARSIRRGTSFNAFRGC